MGLDGQVSLLSASSSAPLKYKIKEVLTIYLTCIYIILLRVLLLLIEFVSRLSAPHWDTQGGSQY